MPTVFKQFNINRPVAPVGVSIKSYEYSTNGDSLKVELDGFDENMNIVLTEEILGVIIKKRLY